MKITYSLIAFSLTLLLNSYSQEILTNNVAFDPRDLSRAELNLRALETNSAFPGLPILVEVSVSNATAASLVLPFPTLSKRDAPQNTLDLFIMTEKGAQRIEHVIPSFGPWKEGLQVEWPRLMRLQPGTAYSLMFPLSYDWFDWQRSKQTLLTSDRGLRLFAKLNSLEAISGSEARRVRRDDGKSSGTIEIITRLPTAADRAAYEAAVAHKRGWRLCAPDTADYFPRQDDFLFFDSFAKDYAGTAYATYAKAVLAYMLSNDIGRRAGARESARQLIDEIKNDGRFLLRDSLASLERRVALSQP